MTEQPTPKRSKILADFIERKLAKNGSGKGKPSFLKRLKQSNQDPYEEMLNILELAWIKFKSPAIIGKRYKTSHQTIWRLITELLPHQEELIGFLKTTSRRKVFFNPKTNRSDYPTVQQYIDRAKRDGLKKWRHFIRSAERVWKALGYKDPATWKANAVIDFLMTIKGEKGGHSGRSSLVDAVRLVAPQCSDRHSNEYLQTGRWRERIGKRRKPLFGEHINMIHQALQAKHLAFEQDIFDLHITLGAREGSSNSNSGMVGLGWTRFKDNFSHVDLWESKVRQGIWSRGCPVDQFFHDLPRRLRSIWIERGKPKEGRLILGGYKELTQIYVDIRQAIVEYWEDREDIDPSTFQEMATVRPHDSDKIHVNCLWEAGVPLEVVKGIYEGHGEGQGLVGRIWLDINTITGYYLSLTRKSKRFQQIRDQIINYSRGFETGDFSIQPTEATNRQDGKQFKGGDFKTPRGGR